MNNIFFAVVDMSITAGYVILAVILVRFLLKKAPRKYSYLLWSVVAFRLVCPVSFESALCLIPDFSGSAVTKESDVLNQQKTGEGFRTEFPDNGTAAGSAEDSSKFSGVMEPADFAEPKPRTSAQSVRIWHCKACYLSATQSKGTGKKLYPSA